jgi:hypothetical protein
LFSNHNYREPAFFSPVYSLYYVLIFASSAILFAKRWDDPEIPAFNSVQAIRRSIFGVQPETKSGIPIASIHTMGSPIALFSLLDVQESGHDLTPKLEELLKSLCDNLQGNKLPWRNYIHPGDPVAWPLDPLLFGLLKGVENCVDIQDVVTHNADLSDFLTQPFSQTFLALLHGGDAHGSYWTSQEVVKEITKILTQLAPPAVAV